MDRDIRTYFMFVGLSAVLITAAGLALLVFGSSGLTSEVRRSRYDEQYGRYMDNLKSRLATRRKAYLNGGQADYVWPKGTAPLGTNVPDRLKYGWFPGTNSAVVGWARLDDGTVIGYDMKRFEYADRWRLYVFGVGAAMVLLLFFTLCACGWRLAWAARRAREDLELKDSFLDMVSHELNTPLGSIVPLSAALAEGGIKDANRRAAALDTVRRESARMARMIGELLTMARLRNGKVPFSVEAVDLGEISAAAANLVRSRYPDCAIRVSVDGRVFARADRDKAEQVVINLLENACRYAGDGAIDVFCRRGAEGMPEVEVCDRGPGLPAEGRERLFDRFCQGGGDATSNGLGLGLAIVAGFVRGMGGKVVALDREGGGSTFRVSLPGEDVR